MSSDILQIKNSKGLTVLMIAAVSSNGFIGAGGRLPWSIPSDLDFFKKQTLNTFIIMGRNTYESIGKALPGRVNIVITKNYKSFLAPGCIVVGDIASALKACLPRSTVFVCGGEDIYRQFMGLADEIILNNIEIAVDGNARFPDIDSTEWSVWKTQRHSVSGEPAQIRAFYIRTSQDS